MKDVVSREVFEQVMWERDVALKQLEDLGVGFGEKVHGRWVDKATGRYGQWQSWCSVCGKHSGIGGIESNRHKPYCPNCGAKMDLD